MTKRSGCQPEVRKRRRALLRWYDAHHRKLPWRAGFNGSSGPTPYHVLVSEAMLQQTQVATVIPYFHRFIKTFPTAQALAAAEEQQVLRLWQGLGYYRRARHLHAAARMIVDRFGGQVPHTVSTLLELPGVGRYTAGAVASIAFGVRAAILDGNVVRVLSRWHQIEEPVDNPATRKRLWTLAEEAVDEQRPGDFNQAMMELGAMICTPREPRCTACPVARECLAYRSGRQRALPLTASRKPRQAVTHTIMAVETTGGRHLFEQRPTSGLWSNMWQLATSEEAVTDAPAWVREQYGLEVGEPEPIITFTHVTTHRDITFVAVRCPVTGGRRKPGAGVWRRLDDVDDLPLAKPQQRVIATLKKQG